MLPVLILLDVYFHGAIVEHNGRPFLSIISVKVLCTVHLCFLRMCVTKEKKANFFSVFKKQLLNSNLINKPYLNYPEVE